MEPDLILTEGNVVTLDDSHPGAEAVGLAAGRITHVGSNAVILSTVTRGTTILPLQGATVLPGFIDTHVHLLGTGIQEVLGVNCSAASSIVGILESIGKKAAEVHEGEWIIGFGFDDDRMEEKRCPTPEELSEVSPRNPVWIQKWDWHSSVLGTEAIQQLDVATGQPGVDLNEKNQITGVVRGEANYRVTEKVYSCLVTPGLCKRAFHAAATQAAKVGLTTIHALAGGSWETNLSSDWLLENGDCLPVKIVLYDQTTEIDRVTSRGLNRIGGCLLVDGSLASHTAALYEPYSDHPTSRGNLHWKDDDLNAFVSDVHRSGLQLAMHAIGERGIDQLLHAYEWALRKNPRPDHRHRIEHFLFPTREAIERAATLGLILGMQPVLGYLHGAPGGLYESRLGPLRFRRTKPLKSIIRKGIKIAGGSDSNVTPMNPLLGIHAAVNHPNENERLNVLEAIDLFTRNAAYAAFEESEKGMIKPGYSGDLVVLDRDPRESDPRAIKEIQVLMTLVGGKVIYRKKDT